MTSERGRILIVDDEPEILSLVADIFMPTGYEVTTVTAASEALMLVQTAAPDVILLDIGMPDMDGLTALQRLRVLQPNVPVVMLTGNTDEETGRTALRWGAFDYVCKPFTAAHLEWVVEAAVVHRRH